MRRILYKLLLLSSLVACGVKSENHVSSLSDINIANSPVRSECLGWDAMQKQAGPVDWDDQAPLRVCMILQNDGALAFDVRLRTRTPQLRRQMLRIELHNPVAGSQTQIFPLLWNPFNGIYELNLSQGCLVGAPGGCAELAPVEMRRLFNTLPRSEAYWHPEVQMIISILNPNGKYQNGDPRFVFNWKAASLREPDKAVP